MVFTQLLRLSVALLLVVSAAGIYSEDHWKYSTKLTSDNYVDTIQSEIDNGKTVFVRFIASSG